MGFFSYSKFPIFLLKLHFHSKCIFPGIMGSRNEEVKISIFLLSNSGRKRVKLTALFSAFLA